MGKKLKPLNDQIILKPISEEEGRYGRIIIPDMGNEKPILAEVVRVGEGIYNYHTDIVIPHSVKKGDIVVIPKMGAVTVSLDNEEYYVCQAQQLIATIENEED